ncbi:MAG TPA: hypothetical protein VM884_10605 [Flavisolibacter sp.]|nr:hypothetical protein [Flavisolibacter sp.]
MIRTLFKVFVAPFYRGNAGFFLFFFVIFFGTINGGSLISYHASLLTGILGSGEIMSGVFFFWLLYEAKCLLFVIRIIDSEEGNFLYNLQALPVIRQAFICTSVQFFLYAPVLIYSVIAIIFGLQKAYATSALVIAVFQLLLIACGGFIIYNRINNWLKPPYKFTTSIRLPKPFLSYLLYHFFTERKILLAGLKIFSVLLLYIVLVRNAGKADNDSFLLFYLVILLAHFILPFLSVHFFENELSIIRNLPLQRTQYVMAYLLTYIIVLLPELLYLLLYGQSLLPVPHILAYYGVALASLFLLTAVQYSDALNRDEYIKVVFALFFVSIFALHIKAFLIWMCIQLVIGLLLFYNGFYKCEPAE